MTIKKLVSMGLACALLLCGVNVQAQPPVANPSGLVQGYDFARISPILQEVGFTTETVTINQPIIGERTSLVARAGTAVLIFIPWACNQQTGADCNGLFMRAYYTTPTSSELRNSFNEQWQMTSAVQTADITYLQRYLIGNYGYTRGAFATDALVFTRVATEFVKAIEGAGSGNQISLNVSDLPASAPANVPPGKPMPGDDLADSLNARQKIGNSADAAQSGLQAAASTASVMPESFADSSAHAPAISGAFTLNTVSDVTLDPAFINRTSN